MVLTNDLKRAICSLFEVHSDEGGVHRIIMPLEYPGSSDQIIVRVRPNTDGSGFSIDENGEAALYATLNGGDIETDSVARWAEDLKRTSPANYGTDEIISAKASHEKLIAPYVFRVAEAAQQLHSLATSRPDRQASDFKERLADVIIVIAEKLGLNLESNVKLPIAGGLEADHVLGSSTAPLIIVAATSSTRLLEAEVIYMQYRAEQKAGYVLAVAESQFAVGKKQYERAAYYTSKTVIFDNDAFPRYLTDHARAFVN